MKHLNKLAGKHGVGRVDIVENRFVGMKSRGVYETPGGTILLQGHRNMESLTMDRELAHLRDSLIPRYAELIYNGFWYAPEREALQALIDDSQKTVTGTVRLRLYKGNVTTVVVSHRSRSTMKTWLRWKVSLVTTIPTMRVASSPSKCAPPRRRALAQGGPEIASESKLSKE